MAAGCVDSVNHPEKQRSSLTPRVGYALVVGLVLTAIALASPLPDRVTDRGVYEATAAAIVVPDCGDLHCFRALVPWIVGRLPGPSVIRWKLYAAVGNAAASLAMFQLAVTLGLTTRAAWFASTISAFGFGALYTLHDPFTADPMMFALGPLLTNELFARRLWVAAAVASIGVLAKEFAAAPLYLFAGYAALERRWPEVGRVLAGANAALIVWLVFTLSLMIHFNYSYGGSESANLASGAGLLPWLQRQSLRGISFAMFNEFGALYVLAPVGWVLAARGLRLLTVAAIPVALVLAYVQQPDRALWNFHFIAAPLAAVTLDRVDATLAAATVTTYVVGNLRVGAQLPIAQLALGAVVSSLGLALLCAAGALRGGLSVPLPRHQATS